MAKNKVTKYALIRKINAESWKRCFLYSASTGVYERGGKISDIGSIKALKLELESAYPNEEYAILEIHKE